MTDFPWEITEQIGQDLSWSLYIKRTGLQRTLPTIRNRSRYLSNDSQIDVLLSAALEKLSGDLHARENVIRIGAFFGFIICGSGGEREIGKFETKKIIKIIKIIKLIIIIKSQNQL